MSQKTPNIYYVLCQGELYHISRDKFKLLMKDVVSKAEGEKLFIEDYGEYRASPINLSSMDVEDCIEILRTLGEPLNSELARCSN